MTLEIWYKRFKLFHSFRNDIEYKFTRPELLQSFLWSYVTVCDCHPDLHKVGPFIFLNFNISTTYYQISLVAKYGTNLSWLYRKIAIEPEKIR